MCFFVPTSPTPRSGIGVACNSASILVILPASCVEWTTQTHLFVQQFEIGAIRLGGFFRPYIFHTKVWYWVASDSATILVILPPSCVEWTTHTHLILQQFESGAISLDVFSCLHLPHQGMVLG